MCINRVVLLYFFFCEIYFMYVVNFGEIFIKMNKIFLFVVN